MTAARRTLVLIVLGCVALALALVVYARNRGLDDDLLATIGVVGGVAIIVNSLPTSDDNG